MELYNKYLKIPMGGIYSSEICFIQSFDDIDKNFLNRIEQWVVFNDKYKKYNGFYSGYSNIFFGKNKEKFLDGIKDKVKDITSSSRYHTYIKIINDHMNPHLNGETMLFRYGRKINSIITNDKHKVFAKSFLINMKLTGYLGDYPGSYPNFDECTFSDNDYYIQDYSLNIRNIPDLPNLNILNIIDRSNKLKKIIKKINNKEDEKICN